MLATRAVCCNFGATLTNVPGLQLLEPEAHLWTSSTGSDNSFDTCFFAADLPPVVIDNVLGG